MNDKIEAILEKIKALEGELLEELKNKQEEFFYEVRARKVRFQSGTQKQHKLLVKRLRNYILDASLLNTLTVPVIWFCVVPAVFMDLVVTVYQALCFPIYGIPKVRRGDYIVIDRQSLSYLNSIEKVNCVYCGYFNGLLAWLTEVAARTEQFWCPIKHAGKTKAYHSRYGKFFDYGDASGYRERVATVRRAFDDLEEEQKDKG